MNKLILALATLVVLTAAAHAQEEVDETARVQALADAAFKIKFADTNADDKLDLAEIRSARAALRKSLIEARDDKTKTKAISEANKNLLEMQVFLAADTSNDYSLETEELAGYLLSKSVNKRWRLSDADIELLAQDVGEDRWEWTKVKYDSDVDGRISANELGKELKTDKDKREFEAADLDKDGALSAYEFMKFGIDRFKEKAKDKVEKARAEFNDYDAANADPYALYKKKGRKWMHKTINKIEGMDPMVSYMSYEITDVSETESTQLMLMLDKDKKPMAGMEKGIESKIPLVAARVGPVKDAPKLPEMKRENAKCEAGEFDCYLTESHGFKVWSSVKYPGLLIKMEGTQTTMELIEFHDGE